MGKIVRHEGLFLTAVLLVAAGVRAAALWSLSETVYFDALLTDERAYHEWAVRIAEGTFASRAVYELAPLPAYFMAGIYALLSPDVLYVRLANLVLGVMGCGALYLVGRELGGAVAGLASGLLAALYEPFVFHSVTALKEPLSILGVAGLAWLLLVALREGGRPSPRRDAALAAALGATCGLLVHVRGSYAALVPVCALFAFFGPKGAARALRDRAIVLAALAIGFTLAASPVAARNYRAAGELALTTAQTGRNLYFGNNPGNPTPYYLPVPFASSVPGEQAVQFVIEASRRAGRRLSQSEASAFWVREVARRAAARPGEALGKLGVKALAVLNAFESSDHYHVGSLRRLAGFPLPPLPGLWLVLPLGMAGMVLLGRSSRRHAALAALFAAHALTLVAFVVNARYRLPLAVVLIPFAAAGALHVGRSIAARRSRPALPFAGAAALFAAVGLLPLPGVGDLSGYASTHALLLDGRGERAEAIRTWEAAAAMGGAYSPVANLFLAGKAADRGDTDAALRLARSIPDTSFAAAAKHALIGDLRLRAGDAHGAVESYERSLGINSGQRRIRRELIRLYARLAPEKVEGARAGLEWIESFFGNE